MEFNHFLSSYLPDPSIGGQQLFKDKQDARQTLALAYEYFKRFDNVYGGLGIVHNGCIEALRRPQTMEKLAVYADLGIDEVICNLNVGRSQSDALAAMEHMAKQVIPNSSQLNIA